MRRCNAMLVGLAMSLVLCEAPARADFVELPEAGVEKLVKPFLKPDEGLAHKVMWGPFGPGKKTLVVLTETGPEAQYGGFVLVPKGRKLRRVELPPFDEYAGDTLEGVVFASVDGAEGVEAVVVAHCITGIGPTGAEPFPSHHVITWDAKAGRFQRLEAAEKTIARLDSLAAVRKKINEVGRLTPLTVDELKPPPKAKQYCDGRVYPKGGPHISWWAYADERPRAKVAKEYVAKLGRLHYERSPDTDTWRVPLGRPEAVLNLSTPDKRGPWRECKPPKGTKTVVLLSRFPRGK